MEHQRKTKRTHPSLSTRPPDWASITRRVAVRIQCFPTESRQDNSERTRFVRYLRAAFIYLLIILWYGVFHSPPATVAAPTLRGSDIQIESTQTADTIVFPVPLAEPPKVFSLADPPRLIFDFRDLILAEKETAPTLKSGRVKEMRVAQFESDPPIVRMVLDIIQADLSHKIVQQDKSTGIVIRAKQHDKASHPQQIKPGATPPVSNDQDLEVHGTEREAHDAVSNTEKRLGKEKHPITPTPLVSLPPLHKQPNLHISVNGKRLDLSPPWAVRDGYLMVPARVLFNALGLPVIVDEAKTHFSVWRENIFVLEQDLGTATQSVNGFDRPTGTPSIIENGTTYVPLVSTLRNLGYGLKWDAKQGELLVAPRILGITPQVVSGIWRVTVTANDLIQAEKTKVLENPHRLVVDFPHTFLGVGTGETLTKQKGVAKLRYSQFDATTTRLVVDLNFAQPHYVVPKDPSAVVRVLLPPEFTKVIPEREEEKLTLKLYFSKPIQDYQIKQLQDPDRLIVDLPWTRFQADLLTPVNVGPVEKVRASQFTIDPLTSRIVVDLTAPINFTDTLAKDGLTLSLTTTLPPDGAVEKAPPPNTYLKGKVIVVDPGHGGSDPGTEGASGKQEKHLNLKTALKLAERLDAAGAVVLLTREEDTDTTLKGIVDFANSNHADLFISVHHNGFHPRTRGTETYWYNDNSRALAERIHQEMLTELGLKDRKCQQERFYVVRHTTMPAVLVEPGFLTNATEEKLLWTEDYQDRTARAIFNGIVAYLKRHE